MPFDSTTQPVEPTNPGLLPVAPDSLFTGTNKATRCPVCRQCLPVLASGEPARCDFCPWGVSLVRPPFPLSLFRYKTD